MGFGGNIIHWSLLNHSYEEQDQLWLAIKRSITSTFSLKGLLLTSRFIIRAITEWIGSKSLIVNICKWSLEAESCLVDWIIRKFECYNNIKDTILWVKSWENSSGKTRSRVSKYRTIKKNGRNNTEMHFLWDKDRMAWKYAKMPWRKLVADSIGITEMPFPVCELEATEPKLIRFDRWIVVSISRWR